MDAFLLFFRLSDAVPLLLLAWLLQFVGSRIAGDGTAVRRWTRGFAAAGFLLYAGAAIDRFGPRTASDFLKIGAQAVLAMATVHGLALVTLPVLRFLYVHIWAIPVERARELAKERARQAEEVERARQVAEREQQEREQAAEAGRREQEEIARRPPPPTREERMAAALLRYEGTLRMLEAAGLDAVELPAVRTHAKQQYLRDIDEALQ